MPACLLCLLLALPALAAPPTAPYQPDADTVLLWHFDDAAAASAVDSSPAGDHPGTVTGATTVEGRFGRALRWSEETGQVVARGDLRLGDSFTVEAWVRLDKLPTGQPPFWAADVLGKLSSFFIAIRPPGVLYVGLQVGEQTNWLSGQTVLPVGEWAHLALVYDGPASKAGVYVNGHRDTEFDLVLGPDRRLHHSDSPFFLRSYSGGDEKLVGAIDEVRLLARAETFGQPWSSAAYLHPLRYRAAFLVGARLSPSPAGAAQELRFSLADPSGREVIGQRLTPAAVSTGAVVPAPNLPAGTYRAQVTVTWADGSRTSLLDQTTTWTPADPATIALRDDGVMLRSGRPFFPLGLYHVRQQDLALVAAGGFNFVASHASTFPPDWPQPGDGVGYLEAAGQAGLTSVGLGAGIHRPEAAAKVFGHYRANPAVVTWYLADEPGGPGEQPEDLRRGYEQWAALDPTHPIFLLQNKPGEFYRYAPACDIFATDPYPIRADAAPPLGQVAEYTRGAVDAVFGQKPVWVALQCYTVRSATEPARELPPRLPTLDELRNMSYQALAAGARGLLYYAFDDTYFNNGQIRGVHLAREYPDFWAQLQTLAAEVGAHRELWCAPYATARPRADLPDLVVQSRPYQLDGALALLVVNLQRAPREARVALPGLPDQVAVTDLLGGSPGGLAGGVLTDRLGPLQAKCYRIPTKAAAESRP